jgi:drug/metabolite transporter (DMT)-like permease
MVAISTTSSLPTQDTLRAGLYMVAAMAAFVCNDSFVKALNSELPVGEIVAIRGVFATLFIFGVCLWQGVLESSRAIFTGNVFWRANLDMVSTLLFITALMHMPIANLTSVMQVVPLVVIAFAALFLKERVGWRRTLAVLIGFIGVAFIVKPSLSGFTIYEAFALIIVFALAIRDIITRRIPAHVPSLIIALANAGFVAIGGLLLMLFEGYTNPAFWHLAYLIASALFLATGYFFMVKTLRTGDIAATAPFRYSNVVFAIISGVVVFGEIPDSLAVVGMILIVASGIYAIHRETKLKRIAKMRSR